ncbi:hypothetical protein [Brevibacillus laterosporus]|uniref:Uncharacterized protein n=1 Tax=Brevibacillus laterosporus TaxID=1465 RepID=A0AAP8QHT7_BRELA|nr:hypothetical protein [Brevibacillus laterosporus]PPB12818.1 hypothetical protein C4A77_00090 [Brevibacillus laterosporus]
MAFNFQYNDPLLIEWRKGDETDPYIDRTETHKIINNRIVLSEIPAEFHRVEIYGYSEIDQRKPDSRPIPLEDEFIVTYYNGFITFHPSQEYKTVAVSYKGRGMIQYPASRIYAHNPNSDVVENLQHIIDTALIKIIEVGDSIDKALEAAKNANMAAEGAFFATNRANQATEMALSASDKAIKAGNNADEKADLAYKAAMTTRLIWLKPVDKYEDIALVYPNPEIGSTTMVLSTGSRYRYEGDGNWKEIDNYTRGSIPLANDKVDGLISSEDFNLIHDKLQIKSIYFVLPTITMDGVQKYIIPIPFDCKIKSIKAICNKPSSASPTHIFIEKISGSEFGTHSEWKKITDLPIQFKTDHYSAFIPPLLFSEIKKDDVLRLFVEADKFDPLQEGISIQIDVVL